MSRTRKIFLFVALPLLIVFVGLVIYLGTNRFTAPGVTSSQSGYEARIEAALAPTTCPTETPVFLDGYYQGPLIDAHFHPASIPDADPNSQDKDYLEEKLYTSLGVNSTIGELVCMFRSDGTTPRNILAFFPVYPNIQDPALKVVKQTVEQYPGVFVPFLNPPDGDSPTANAATVDSMLTTYPGLFKGYGEIALYGNEKEGALPPDSPVLQEILPVLRKHGVKRVFFHLGVGHKDSLDKVAKANPDLTFIFHGDQLISKYEDGRQNVSQIDELLSNNPNLYYGVDEFWMDKFLLHEKGSKEEVFNHLKDYGPLLEYDIALWKPFIERHPDQVMWDTDRGTYLWTTDIEVGQALVKYARRFIAELDPSVQEKYAYKNAERALIGQ